LSPKLNQIVLTTGKYQRSIRKKTAKISGSIKPAILRVNDEFLLREFWQVEISPSLPVLASYSL
jgi:hypothetical protein